MQRVALLLAAARDSGAWVDFEWTDWRRSANIRHKVLLACTPPDGGPPRLILSHHDLHGPPDDARALVTQMHEHASVAKLAYRARNAADGLLALDLMREFGNGVIAVAMGEEGAFTRLLAQKFAAWGTYAALPGEVPTAAGQYTIPRLVALHRWSCVGPSTRVYGVLGDPIAFSLSPALHAAWFVRYGMDAVYLPFLVHAEDDGLIKLLDACAARPWLHVGGFSITAPHKESALRWTGANPDRLARTLGATNTLVWSHEDVRAYNTDAHAALEALCAAMKIPRDELHGYSVDILGAGGAGRALAITLGGLGCRVTVFDRRADRAESAARAAGGAARPLSEAPQGTADILIDATSRREDAPDDAPLPPSALAHRRMVFDVRYRPPRSALLRAAQALNVPAINGIEMFLRQAAVQFALWTGIEPDLDFGRDAVQKTLAANAAEEA